MTLLKKPEACKGCPAYGDGWGFVPDEMVEGADVAICGQNPGDHEEKGTQIVGYSGGQPVTEPHAPAPYLGATGYVMERQYLPVAGLERGKVSILNAMRCRWNHTNTMKPLDSVEQRAAIEHCTVHHRRLPSSTKLVIAEGEYALWSLTGEGIAKKNPECKYKNCECKANTISAWRGYVLPYNPPPKPSIFQTEIYQPSLTDLKVLATYHLAYLFHAPWDTAVSRADWAKVPKILSGHWPAPLPSLIAVPPNTWPGYSAFDTEFHGEWLLRYSLAYNDKLHVVERENARQVWMPPDQRIVVAMHNAEADIPHLSKILPGTSVFIEDTMYKHAVLWPDFDHNLGFVGSIYAPINRWKHLVHVNPRIYAGGDAWATLHIDMNLSKELKNDKGSYNTYYERMLPLLPLLVKARAKGIKVNVPQAQSILGDLDKAQYEAVTRAQAAVGWPINLASGPQVAHQLYEIEKVDRNPISGKRR